ncbi:LacI family DNA-binding transcriptional regulator [Serinibacter salmoneus]|uniref:LacI family transcriptional regulator n=1 Tax=Serinibacter salmoneus TaxID=556530 RepID=A0A2A9CXC3_9MICO|nr:LacI family DNA-binding transcriptional regulator [Serinibacter salmoneus]PFG18786.1 LacI family transcriptional regulator [Serinibacter salmoneus]
MAHRVTLSDVAREAGVSLATASRAINGSADRSVRPELARRVEAAAARLRYVPDATAQAMARGRTTSLGLIVHDISDPYFSAIADAVVRRAEAEGLQVTLATTQNDAAREADLVDLMRRQRVRAIVVAGGRMSEQHATALEEAVRGLEADGGRVALIGQPVRGTHAVALDNVGGARDLGEALLARGYRRFALLGGPEERVTAADRRRGFTEAIHGHSGATLADADVLTCDFTWEGGYDAMTQLLARGTEAQVVLAANDVMALGALAAIRESGRTVPRDLALTGFGGVSTLRDVTPRLTTVQIPMAELGERATALALGPASGPQIVTIPCTVAMGESTPDLTD